MNNKEFGDQGEKLAEEYLIDNGFSIVKRKFQLKIGEIDLIAVKDGALCFVEVKTRNKDEYLSAVESITPHKQRKLAVCAEAFLKGYKGDYDCCRFDAAIVLFDDHGGHTLEYLENIYLGTNP